MLLWALMIVVTAVDAALLVLAWEAYGRGLLLTVVRRLGSDPLFGVLAAEILFLRLGAMLALARLPQTWRGILGPALTAFVPLLGAPLLFAALVGGTPAPARRDAGVEPPIRSARRAPR